MKEEIVTDSESTDYDSLSSNKDCVVRLKEGQSNTEILKNYFSAVYLSKVKYDPNKTMHLGNLHNVE